MEQSLTIQTSSVKVFTPAQIVSGRDDIIARKRVELAAAREAIAALKSAGAGHSRVDRLRERARFIEKTITALEMGYVPIPRFDSLTLNLEAEELPAQALVALAYAQSAEAFDEIRIVRGMEPQGGRGNPRRGARDPLLVGVISSPNHQVDDGQGRWNSVQFIPGRSSHFLIAWWQPEDERPETMF